MIITESMLMLEMHHFAHEERLELMAEFQMFGICLVELDSLQCQATRTVLISKAIHVGEWYLK